MGLKKAALDQRPSPCLCPCERAAPRAALEQQAAPGTCESWRTFGFRAVQVIDPGVSAQASRDPRLAEIGGKSWRKPPPGRCRKNLLRRRLRCTGIGDDFRSASSAKSEREKCQAICGLGQQAADGGGVTLHPAFASLHLCVLAQVHKHQTESKGKMQREWERQLKEKLWLFD